LCWLSDGDWRLRSVSSHRRQARLLTLTAINQSFITQLARPERRLCEVQPPSGCGEASHSKPATASLPRTHGTDPLMMFRSPISKEKKRSLNI
jgi:hypothetical protein